MSEPINGLLLVDKPVGPTSMDVVRAARRALDTRKIGHTGTLDPLASGLLAVTVGRCTKLAKFLSLEPKVYTFEAVFGEARTTDDPEGELVETGRSEVDESEIISVIPQFLGRVDQVPPRYSAVKIDGKRAYDLARNGEEFELKPRSVHIESLELLECSSGVARMRLVCGSGTYVRSIARDLARALGTVAHARAIRRTGIGAWSVTGAISLEELRTHENARTLPHGVRTMLAELPEYPIDAAERRRVLHGHALPLRDGYDDIEFVSLVFEDDVVAVAQVREKYGEMQVQPRRVLE